MVRYSCQLSISISSMTVFDKLNIKILLRFPALRAINLYIAYPLHFPALGPISYEHSPYRLVFIQGCSVGYINNRTKLCHYYADYTCLNV